jgi:hypothetical protein
VVDARLDIRPASGERLGPRVEVVETRHLAAVAGLSTASYAAAATAAAAATPRQTQYGKPAHTVTGIPSTVSPAPPPGNLPFTGFEIAGAALVGAVLVMSGLAARRMGARRKA